MSCRTCPPSVTPPWHREFANAATNEQVFTGNGTIDLGIEHVVFKQNSAPDEGDAYEITLPDVDEGCSGGRMNLRIYGPYESTTAPFRVNGTFAGGFTSYLFNNLGFNLLIEWRDDRWWVLGGNAVSESS